MNRLPIEEFPPGTLVAVDHRGADWEDLHPTTKRRITEPDAIVLDNSHKKNNKWKQVRIKFIKGPREGTETYASPGNLLRFSLPETTTAPNSTEATLADRLENFWHAHDANPCNICKVMNMAADELRAKDAETERLRADLANAQHIVANRQTAAEAKIVALREVSSGDDVNKPDLREFCRAVLQVAREGHDLDGGSIQDLGLKHGLLVEVPKTEPCGDACACAEYGDFPLTCYWMHKDLVL